MKHILSILLVVVTALGLCSGPPKPPAPKSFKLDYVAQQTAPSGTWSFNVVYDFKGKKWDAVALDDLHELTIKGKPTGFFFSAFAGTTTDKDGKAVAGFGVSHHRQLFDQIYVQSFAGIKVEANVPIGPVLGFGFGYRF